MTLRLDHDNGIAVLTLARPPVNALDLASICALEAAFEALGRSPPPSGLVLTGEGATFCAGIDTREFAAGDAAHKAEMFRAITRMVTGLYGLGCPVVGAINGHALGGGFVLMLACDARFAVDDAGDKLGLTEARAGVPFPAGALEVMRAELSADLLRTLTLTSAVRTPAEMAAAGPVDRLVARDDLLRQAKAMARELAGQPAFGAVKAQLRAPVMARLEALVASGDDPVIAALS